MELARPSHPAGWGRILKASPLPPAPRKSEFAIQNPEVGSWTFSIPKPEFRKQRLKFGSQNSESRMRQAEFGMQNSELGIQNSESEIRKPEFHIRNSEYEIGNR